MELRATNTKSIGVVSSCWCTRKLSRNNRLARLRTTAEPIFPEVITPNREEAPAGKRFQLAIKHPTVNRSPAWRTAEKSLPCLIRADLLNQSRCRSPADMRGYTGVSRFRPTRRRLRRIALPLLLELRLKNPCCRLRRRFDG